jgi:hypothetical protein
MKLDPDQYEKLARVLLRTRPDEMSCEDWLEHVGAYAEHLLAGRSVPASLAEVEQHMRICPECAEEFRAILASLRDEA